MYLERLDGNEILFEQVIKQIEKDFGQYWSVNSEHDLDPQNLKIIVSNIVASLLDENITLLLNLCYRVDLTEAKVSPILYSNELTNAVKAQRLSAIILDREVQKVWTRMHYRS